jgi:glycolate oxidase FAD binding subunit
MQHTSPPSQALFASLRALIGAQSVQWSVDVFNTGDDASPPVAVIPRSEEDVAAVLAFATREGLKIVVRGGGQQLGLGFPAAGGDLVLSTTELDRLIEHAPLDMTVTAQAGLRLWDLQQRLSDARQWLALDPALGREATIGGVIATNASGMRRLRYGGVRDHLLGVRVALPDGTIASGGGKVVKNVAGYDLPKLYCGSLGTLGVILAATFRLYPLPPASRRVTFTSTDLSHLCQLALQILDGHVTPVGLDLACAFPSTGAYTLAVTLEMGEGALAEQTASLLGLVGELHDTAHISDNDPTRIWCEMGDPFHVLQSPGEGMALKVSVLPTEMERWLQEAERLAQRHDLSLQWQAHAGHGIIFARFTDRLSDVARLAAVVEPLRAVALERSGSLVVIDASPALARRIDVWGPVPALDVMRRLKAQFDPHATLNPGRFVGGI